MENIQVSDSYRRDYEAGIRAVIASRRADADAARQTYAAPERMAARQEEYRAELRRMLGWPLTETEKQPMNASICVESELEPGILMRRVQLETLAGLPFYGILLIPQGREGKLPLVISQHGGWGTPEQTADLHTPNNYKSMSVRLARAGCVVFAPQLLLWREDEGEEDRVGYRLRHHRSERENELRQLGGSIAAVEVHSIMRSIDWLAELPFVDASRIGMIGVSYGGFYTQMTGALDTRIRAAVSNAFFNERYRYCWQDFAWFGSAFKLLDAEICALIAPRALCVHVGTNDHVFAYEGAANEIERLKPHFAAHNASQKLRFILSDVNHTLTDTGEEMAFLLEQLKS